MTDIIPTTMGGYPRPDSFKGYLRRKDGMQKGAAGEAQDSEYEKAINEIMQQQKNSGIRLFTDGQLLWQDFLCYLATKIQGFEMTGLIRYFNNNVYYRMPRVASRLERKREIVLEEFKLAKKIQVELKAVLSCFTLAKLSQNEFYKSKEEFVLALAEIMHQEAKELAENGAKYIQIDEPSLLYAGKEDLQIAKEALDTITKGIKAKFFLATYFGDGEQIFPEILDFPIDVLGLDFVEGYEANMKLLKEYKPKHEIQAGIVDGRNTKMEKKEEIRKKVDNILETVNGKTLYIAPNTGLEFLPWIKASEKLKIMCDSIR